jgi:ParB/RepB/Spo0J family partition protein
MSIKAIRKKTVRNNSKKKTCTKASCAISIREGEFKKVAISDIDLSPLNYRKYISGKALEDFAAELALHGIISPLTLRPMASGRYELVAGERRFRAAKIAGLSEVPATVRALADEEVIEIQLSENLQREDPHPMHEAQAIGQMQQAHKSTDQIAARLGKSKTFVFSRVKLLSLIEGFQELFLSDKIKLREALEIATLSEASQLDLFNECCENWKEKKKFSFPDLEYSIRKYKYDLKRAPFDTKDKNLLPDVGACSRCPFNSACFKSLFPEYVKEALCTNKECYEKKGRAHLYNQFTKSFDELKPDAFLFNGEPSEFIKELIISVTGAQELPKYDRYLVNTLSAPKMPDKEDYMEEDEQGNESIFCEDAFNEALDEYEMEMVEFTRMQKNGEVLKGMFVSEHGMGLVFFNLETTSHIPASHNTTAKEVEAAIKAGTATVGLLQSEINRINSRETRLKELDTEKIQLKIHEAFASLIVDESFAATAADLVAARLIIFQSLDYTTKREVAEKLFSVQDDGDFSKNENLFKQLAALTGEQFGYLIRTAIISHSESKLPRCERGYFLREIAGSIGLDIASIEKEQLQKASARKEKQEGKIEALQKKINMMKENV